MAYLATSAPVPKVTVKDGETVIDPKQYTVTWANDDSAVTDGLLTAAGTYTATEATVASVVPS